MRVLLGGCALIVLSSCDRFGGGDEDAGAPSARLVVVGETELGDAVETVRILGDLQGEVEVRVFSELPARIRVLHVREGDRVSAGDPIATLDSERLSLGVEQATAAIDAAAVARDQLLSDLERARRLFASGAVPESQVTTLEAQLRSAEANIHSLSTAARSAGAERRRAVVRAPVDGVVAQLAFNTGDTVAGAVPICSIVQAEHVELMLRATEADYVRIHENMVVTVSFPALPDLSRPGVVTSVSPVLDRITRTASVEITIDNADGALRPGMTGRAAIELSRRTGVVLVAAQAVIMLPETDETRRAMVFVIEEGHANRRDVTIGPRTGDRIEIVEGLTAGTEVVLEGQHLLRDGVEVRTTRSSRMLVAPTAEPASEPASEPAPETP
jgi:RND family efflux transporter MFP subunit